MANLSDMLSYLRKREGLSQQDLADKTGLTRSAIGMYEAGQREPSLETLELFADFFNVNMDVLTGRSQEIESAKKPVRIPVLGAVPAGIPIEAIEDVVDWEEIPASMLSGGREYFGLRVTGNSMYPDFIAGDVIIVRKTQAFESGDTCVVYVNGYDATLKRVKIEADGSFSLIPRNPEWETKTYTPQEIKKLPVTVAGVVVELRRKV